jgi:hypothetical protein
MWHRVRSHRFESLPVLTRGLFAELLAHTDDEGRIRLGTNDRNALWRLIGGHRQERRGLIKALDQLVEDGSVVEHPDGWELPSFREFDAPDICEWCDAPRLTAAEGVPCCENAGLRQTGLGDAI